MINDDTKTSAVEAKWGDAAKAGFVAIPDVLLKHQATLGLSDTELVVLINICSFWWFADRLPYPQTSTIAQRMGAKRTRARRRTAVASLGRKTREEKPNPRTVQRALASLQRKGLIWKVPRASARPFLPEGYREDDRGRWDLSGLISRLEGLAKKDPQYLRKVGKTAGVRAEDGGQVLAATG